MTTKRDERRELVKALAVASYVSFRDKGNWRNHQNDWIGAAINDADALLAAPPS